jgi:hypothetical protein
MEKEGFRFEYLKGRVEEESVREWKRGGGE